MTTTVAGYKFISVLHQGAHTVIYRAVKERDKTTAIVKTLKAEYPTLEELARLRHEYKILRDLDIEGIVKPYSLENYNNGLALILSDFWGDSLKNAIASRPLSVMEFLNIAIQLAETLSKLHENNIIHKDIKPHNILINRESGQVKITDFSIATRLSRETQTLSHPKLLEGTLAYMSPEQTGRMNRSIDYRTDFYSLGVTFYEMLTGIVPFPSTDLMELVHCHIALAPMPPFEVNPEIPPAISNIVMKLLAKTAEDRYQSALGLKFDLETCLMKLKTVGATCDFTVGSADKAGQLLIPQKLYGRDREVQTLLAAFERVSGVSSPSPSSEMTLVSGYSGIGKTVLVNEIHKPITAQRGYFIAGKFDQFKRNIPYISVIQAFQSLIGQLLTESEAQIQDWKEKLLAALGVNGQVIIDVIPEVEFIIGKQPPVPSLGSTESQNRFSRVFKQFIGVFTTKEHPLVVFLDDLQWADLASLKLLELLMTDPDSQYLLLIGAYRDNEVFPAHPTLQAIEKIRSSGATVNNIVLEPLQRIHVEELISDTLNKSARWESLRVETRDLASLLFNKTGGNPFFLTQLLKTFYQENLLRYDLYSGAWQWNVEQIQAIGIADLNVVELTARNICKLPSETQKVLKLAACIGNTFNLDVLALVNQESSLVTAAQLWSALQAGLILPLSNDYKIPLAFSVEESGKVPLTDVKVDYKFLHDRVQQAAYSLIPDDQKKETHLKIGKLLLQNTTPEERRENIFALVNQLNYGTDLLAADAEKYELAELNLIAGQKAKAATAYDSAVKYFNVGLGLLKASSWSDRYPLTFALHEEAAEAEFLAGHFEEMEQLISTVLQKAKTLLEKVKVWELRMKTCESQSKLLEAVKVGLHLLEMLGVKIPESPTPYDIQSFLETLQANLAAKNIEELIDLPLMEDAHKLTVLRLLTTLVPPAFLAAPSLFPILVAEQVNLSLKYGNSPYSSSGFADYGIILSGVQQEIEKGYQFGQLAANLVARFNARAVKCQTLFKVGAFTIHWKYHVRETLPVLKETYLSGLENGDLANAGYSASQICQYLYWSGVELNALNQEMNNYSQTILKINQTTALNWLQPFHQFVLNLLGESENSCVLIGKVYDEKARLPIHIQGNERTVLHYLFLNKLVLGVLFEEIERAEEFSTKAEEYLDGVVGLLTVPLFHFYDSLVQLAIYPSSPTLKQEKILKKVLNNQEKMKFWAHHCPENFQHKYDLVEAEINRILGQPIEAMENYDRAIAGAKENEYVNEEALAHELAAKFYLSWGKQTIAQTYITNAYYAYMRWGAKAKLIDLEAKYPDIFSAMLKRETPDMDVTRTTTSSRGLGLGTLDLAAVMKASQALSSEMILGKLLSKLMKIAIANAGAQTGCLILEKEGKLFIEATGAVDRDDLINACTPVPVHASQNLPLSVVNYVARTQENVVLNEAYSDGIFATDPYIATNKPKSVLCTPIINQGKFIGLLYLENNLATGAFTAERIEVLKIISSQAAISIENARLYANLSEASKNLKRANEQLEDYSQTLEHKVEERTQELKEKNQRLIREIRDRQRTEEALRLSEAQLKTQAQQLENALSELQQTQMQLIQTEKMSSLGQMVAGVAHEINNPVNFIYGNLSHANDYTCDLLKLIRLYQEDYLNPTPRILAHTEAIELDFISEDLPRLLSSMRVGADRIREIVQSLRNFSRLDESQMKPVDIHQGIDNTLLLLQGRLKAKPDHPAIDIVKEYGKLPEVECYAGQLNQVFMNILANAIDVLEERDQRRSPEEIMADPGTITIRTSVVSRDKVAIRISDNGPGMTEHVRKRLFDPFFTTKPVGKGTGLGLSISYQIVVEKHGGSLHCISAPSKGAEFAIEIPLRQQALQTA